MNIFTNDDYRRIQAWLKANAIKDSEFAISENTVPDKDILVITQNMSTVPTNYKIKIKDLLNSSLGKVVIDKITANIVKVNNSLTVDASKVILNNKKGTTLQDVLDYFEGNKLNRHTDDTFDGNLTVKKNITIEGNIKSHDDTITVEADLEATGEITDGQGNMLSDVNNASKGWKIEYQDPQQDEPTVRAKYVLKDYRGIPKGNVIKIYKDSAITNVYLGTVEDICNPNTGEVTKHPIHDNNEALSIVYRLDTGKYSLVNVPIKMFTTEAEFDKYRGLGVTSNGQVFIKLASDIESSNYLHFNELGEITAEGIEARILRDLGNIITSIAGDGTMWGVYKEHEGTQETSTPNDGSRWGEFKRAEEIREQMADSTHQVFADNWDVQDDDPELPQDKEVVDEASYAYNWKTTDTPASDGSTEGNLKDLYQKTLDTDGKVVELKRNLGSFSQKETDEDGLYICDQNGNVIIRLDILDTKSKIGDFLKENIIEIARKSITPDCVEDGFYICNENGEAIAQYKNNAWELLGLEVKDRRINPCHSSLGLESGVVYADSLTNNTLVLEDYPAYLKRNATVSFGAKISTFSQVKVGVKGGYFCQAQIDSTNISIIHNTGIIKTEAHGLNISGWIDVALKVEELNVEISVHSLDGYKKITATLPFRELYGRPTIEVDENTTLTDVSLRGYCDDFQKSIWFVGDSYTSCTEVRWTGQMLNFGIKNWMLLGLAGGKSKDLYEDLLIALKYGTPVYLVWCMGMNDADNGSLNTDYKKYFELVKAKCDELGIIMVPATVPCVKTSSNPTYARDNSYKNAFIKSSGLRYIDLAKAVGGDTFTEDAWYNGYLETTSPWIHTSELGAKAQAAQIIKDFPEILRNK